MSLSSCRIDRPAGVLDLEQPGEDLEQPAPGMRDLPRNGDVLGGAVLDQQDPARSEQSGRLGRDGGQIRHVVDQCALEHDVGAVVGKSRGRRVAVAETDSRQVPVTSRAASQARV
jgi:hypothetical protein